MSFTELLVFANWFMDAFGKIGNMFSTPLSSVMPGIVNTNYAALGNLTFGGLILGVGLPAIVTTYLSIKGLKLLFDW